mmetsp:Transcript_177008/g.567625  ORF Transcript_177008/g.567625 Transcript_177008/m.567625 type:complete len:131 (+) Transcript_177008:655-1047(+)
MRVGISSPMKILDAFELEAKKSCATGAPSPTTAALTTVRGMERKCRSGGSGGMLSAVSMRRAPSSQTGRDNDVQQQVVQVGEVESIDMSDAPWKKTRLLSPDRPSECEGLGDPRCVANCTEAATAAGVST